VAQVFKNNVMLLIKFVLKQGYEMVKIRMKKKGLDKVAQDWLYIYNICLESEITNQYLSTVCA